MMTVMYSVKRYLASECAMKVTREQAVENRERILSVAAKLFREKGFDGIGVADIMKAAGLTHGGFYGHFKSKDDLISQACHRAVDELLAAGKLRATLSDKDPITLFLENYLSIGHRDNAGSGCLMAALGSEAPRQSAQVRSAFTESAKRLWNTLTNLMSTKFSHDRARQKAAVTLATLVGAQVIARAVDDQDISESVLKWVLQEFDDSDI